MTFTLKPHSLFYKKYFLFFFICIVGKLQAQQIITDRPDQTESSSTVGLGNLQIESGFLFGFEESNQTSSRQILLPSTLFRYGISKGIELRFVNQFESLSIEGKKFNGISDLEFGTKIELLNQEGNNTQIAFLSHLVLPTGSKVLTNDDFGTVNKLSISHQLTERLGIGYNIGYDYFGEGNGDLTYSLAIGVGVNEKVGIYFEPYGALAEFEEFILDFDAGFTYLIKENLQFDFSFGVGANHKMNYIATGMSWLIFKK